MQFNRWEKVTIPYESIARMFDKNGQVIMQWATMVAEEEPGDGTVEEKGEESRPGEVSSLPEEKKGSKGQKQGAKPEESRVIEVDFTKKNRPRDEE